MKLLTLLAHSRPQYVRQCLTALSRCDGIEDYLLLSYSHTRAYPEVLDMLRGVTFCESYTILGHAQAGHPYQRVSSALHHLLTLAFQLSDYVIHLEEDDILAPDSLRYFEHCNATYKDDPTVFSVGAFRVTQEGLPAKYRHRVERVPHFITHAWASWRDRWQEMAAQYDYEHWDRQVQAVRGSRYHIVPSLPRSQNIGLFNGASGETEEWRREHQYTPLYAGNVVVHSGQWWEG